MSDLERDKAAVLAVYPGARCYRSTRHWAVFIAHDNLNLLGEGASIAQAWHDAASRLTADHIPGTGNMVEPQSPAAAAVLPNGETASNVYEAYEKGLAQGRATAVPAWIPLDPAAPGYREPISGRQYWLTFVFSNGALAHGYGIWNDGDWFWDVTHDGDLLSRQQSIKGGCDVATVTYYMDMPPGPDIGND